METIPNVLAQGWLWLVLAAGILLSFLCSGIETGLYRLNRIRLRLRADSGDRRAHILQDLLADLRGMIIVCLLGNNVANYAVTAVATVFVAASGWVTDSSGVTILTTLIVAPLLFVFAEVTPKSLFAAEADHWMYPMARPLKACYASLRLAGILPALHGISHLILRAANRREAEGSDPFHPRQRLRAVLSESAAEGVISGYQHELVTKVLALREKLVRDVMIPMGRVAAVPAGIDMAAFLEHLRRHAYSRLPVWQGRRENVVGIVHINDVLAAKPHASPLDLASVMSREFVSVPADMTVSQAIFRMRKARAAMAIVRDEKDRAVGILTIKDLVEEIVGELAAW